MIQFQYHTPASQYLLPEARSIETGDGTLHLHLGSAYCLDPPFEGFGPLLESQLGLNDGCEDLYFTNAKEALPVEGYQLKVTKDQVVARASSKAGMFQAIQTIRQLYLAGHGLLPTCRIEDSPLYRWRGFMLDCARHFFTVGEIEKLIDAAALHHLNVFHWHLTDDQGWRFPVDGYTGLEAASRRADPEHQGKEYGGFYTEADIREVVDFAEQRFVTVVPEIDVPGHCGALLSVYPQLGFNAPQRPECGWGIFPAVLNPAKAEVFAFLKAAIGTLCRLFPGPYIHIGGDECPHAAWEADAGCRKLMAEKGIADADALQGWFTSEVAKLVKAAGRRAIGWDEVFEFGGDALDKEVIIASWRGSEAGIKAAKAGHQVIMCPKDKGCYLDYQYEDDPEEIGAPHKVSSFTQCATFDPSEGFDEESRKNLLGGQANLWTEYVRNGREAEYLAFPRLALIAERLWNPQPVESLDERMAMEYAKLDGLKVLSWRGASA